MRLIEPDAPELRKYIMAVRRQHRSVTARRLGYEVGAAGDTLPSPYEPDSRCSRLYDEGLRAGRARIMGRLEVILPRGHGRVILTTDTDPEAVKFRERIRRQLLAAGCVEVR